MGADSLSEKFPAGELRVLSVIPGEPDKVSFIFAKREMASLQGLGVVFDTLFFPPLKGLRGSLENYRRLRKRIEAFKPHLIHSHFGAVTALTCTVASWLPFVVTFRGSDLNPNPDRPLLKWAADILFSQTAALVARRVICMSEQLKRRLWWRRGRTWVIPAGIDTGLFLPRSRQEARRELGWQEDELVVLFNAARGRKVKRQDLALASVEAARSLCGEIRFVALDGFVEPDTIPTFMNASDCLLVTSDWEGGPAVVKEALACNLPVVSVDVGDVRELLAGVSSSHVVERDPIKLGEAIARVLTALERSDGFSAVEDITFEKTALRILSVYGEALGLEGSGSGTPNRAR
jgi:glycosyltransferase involved in cell wall biosynthesis